MQNFIQKMKQIPIIRIFSLISIVSFILWMILLFLPFGAKSQIHVFFSVVNPCCETFADFFNPIKYVQSDLVFEYLNENLRRYCCYTPGTFCFFKFFETLANIINPLSPANVNILSASLFSTYSIVAIVGLFIFNLSEYKNIDKVLFCIAFLTSGIFLFSYERGNIILLSVFLSSFFIFYYDSKNKWLKEISLLMLSIAVILKISPAILGVLLVYKKDFKGVFRFAVYSLILFILPALLFPRGIETLLTFKENISFLSKFILTEKELFSFSIGKRLLLNIVCFFVPLSFPISESLSYISKVINNIIYLISIISILCSFFYKQIWRKVLLLTLILMLVPSVSSFYILMYLLPVMVLFFKEKNHTSIDYIYLAYFFVILSPLQIVKNDMNYTIILKHIVILIMFLQEFLYGLLILKSESVKNKISFLIRKRLDFFKYIFKNNNQKRFFRLNIIKNSICIFISTILLYLGCFVYSKNYKYIHYNIENTKNIQVLHEKIIQLKEDFVIDIETIFIPKKTEKYENIFQTADLNNGIRMETGANQDLALLYCDDKKELKALFYTKITPEEIYKMKTRITNKTLSGLLQQKNGNNWNDIESVAFADKIDKASSLQKIIVGVGFSEDRLFSGKVKSFDIKVKNGKNGNIIIILTLLGFLIPLFIMVYFRKFRYFCMNWLIKKK